MPSPHLAQMALTDLATPTTSMLTPLAILVEEVFTQLQTNPISALTVPQAMSVSAVQAQRLQSVSQSKEATSALWDTTVLWAHTKNNLVPLAGTASTSESPPKKAASSASSTTIKTNLASRAARGAAQHLALMEVLQRAPVTESDATT